MRSDQVGHVAELQILFFCKPAIKTLGTAGLTGCPPRDRQRNGRGSKVFDGHYTDRSGGRAVLHPEDIFPKEMTESSPVFGPAPFAMSRRRIEAFKMVSRGMSEAFAQ
jgi:hypothetical protein